VVDPDNGFGPPSNHFGSCNNPLICAISINIHCIDYVRRLIQWMKTMMKTITRPASKHAMSGIGIALAAAVLIAGCASAPAPVIQMAVSRAAVSNANSSGANEFAPVQYKSATDKMNAAEQAMTAENFALALELAEQAEVDAKLATATARSVKAQKAADAVQEDSRVLHKEIDRNTR